VLKIRMQRLGRRNEPRYRLVLVDARSKRQGRYLENLGSYDPHKKAEEKIKFDPERVKHWLGQGAQLTEAVAVLLRDRGVNVQVAAAGRAKTRRSRRKARAKARKKMAGAAPVTQ